MSAVRISKVRLKRTGQEISILDRARGSIIVEMIIAGAAQAREIEADSFGFVMRGKGGWISHNHYYSNSSRFELVGALEDLKADILSGSVHE